MPSLARLAGQVDETGQPPLTATCGAPRGNDMRLPSLLSIYFSPGSVCKLADSEIDIA
jgi:hypothetical protein